MPLSEDQKAVLTARLGEAETALHGLMIGRSAVSLAYDGESVTYTQADEAKLRRYIAELNGQLGLACGPYRRGVRA